MRVLGLTVQPWRVPSSLRENRERVHAPASGAFANTLLRQPATDVVQFGMAPPRPTESMALPSAEVIPSLLPQAKAILGSMADRAGVKQDSLSLDARAFVQGAIYYDDMANGMAVNAAHPSVIMRGKTLDGDQDKPFAFVHLRQTGADWSVSGGNMPYGSLVTDVAAELANQPGAHASLLQGLPGTATSGLTLIKFNKPQQSATFKVVTTANSTWPGTYPADSYAMAPGDVLSEADLGQKVVTIGRMHQEKTLTGFLAGAMGKPDERTKVGRLLPQIVGDAKSVEMLPKLDALAGTEDANQRYQAVAELVKDSLAGQRIRLRPYYDSFV